MGRDRARDRLRGAPHRARPARGDRPRAAGRADDLRRRARSGSRPRASSAGCRGQRRPDRSRRSTWTVGEDGYESRSYNNCFGGRELTGRVLMTVAAGRVAYRQRSFALGVAS